ncbi:MAG TPA: hypothetical protein VK570_07580, partial [Rubrivivax sp.]|nr:hypothetical protein [Rubrivivax sp.]
ALDAMKTALVRNIGGTVKAEKPVTAGTASGIELDVSGTRTLQGRQVPVRMVARLLARGNRVYQALAMGQDGKPDNETAQMFVTSFKPS